MPVVSSLANLPKDGEFYSNNCVDGHCIGCGECAAKCPKHAILDLAKKAQ